MISTRDLSLLPDIARLKALCQSLAMLDAILSPEWEYRYYSFDSRWGENESVDEQMASMRNGSGDEYVLLFTPAGAIMKGFAHEAAMSPYQFDPPHVWPGVLESVPQEFADFLSEPAFSLDETTFCIWRRSQDAVWQHGPIEFPADDDPDGSAELLVILDGKPRTYQAWAKEYYEQAIPLKAVEHMYQHKPLTKAIVAALNADLSLKDLADEIAEIGY
jgi:hypothetical protein